MKKKIVAILVCLLLSLLCAAALADVIINETNFPDSLFREAVMKYDTDGDGTLSDEECGDVTQISCSNMYIQSMKGIEYFTNLEKLFCSDNLLTSLDVSKNTRLMVFDCYRNQLAELDVSNLKGLQSLDCSSNVLKKLDVSKNTKLAELYCYNNSLTRLDVSKNVKLKALSCEYNQLASLNVSMLPGLKYLKCGHNALSRIDVSKNVNLDYFGCNANQLTNLDVNRNSKLEYLHCECNQIGTLDVTKCPKLAKLVSQSGRKSENGYDFFGRDYEGTPLLSVDPATNVKAGKITVYASVNPTRATVNGLNYKLDYQKKTAAFSGPENRNITKLTIPATISVYGKTYKVTVISSGACNGLKKLTQVTIGKNVATIGKKAFFNCGNLKKYDIKTTKLTAQKTGKDAFGKGYRKPSVKCPKSKVDEYQTIMTQKGMSKKAKFTK